MMQPLFKYQLIVDAHNEAIQPYTHNNWVIRYVAQLLMRYSKYTIVTNKYLAKIVDGNGGKAIILPDRVPQIGEIEAIRLAQNTFNIILIATYAADEPISQIIDAACALENKITLYVTGNFSRLDKSYIESLPSNIVFTGFLTNKDYWSYLKSADAIIDLSLKDNCLVCGAYEGIAVGKPLILSNSEATKEYFNKGVVYTDNTTANIQDCYLRIMQNYESLSEEISILNSEVAHEWKQKVAKLCQILEN
jgi:glycosyltransferase involved in cell wall biosynthesis